MCDLARTFGCFVGIHFVKNSPGSENISGHHFKVALIQVSFKCMRSTFCVRSWDGSYIFIFSLFNILKFCFSAAFLIWTSPNNSASKDLALRHEDKTRHFYIEITHFLWMIDLSVKFQN